MRKWNWVGPGRVTGYKKHIFKDGLGTGLKHPLQPLQPRVFLTMMQQFCTPRFSDFLPFLADSARLDGDHWWIAIFRSPPRSSIGFMSGLSSSHRVVLFEGDPSAQSEILSALDQVLIKDISVLCSVHPSLNPSHCPSPFSVGMGIGQVMRGAWFPPDITLRIEAKQFNLGYIRPENLVSMSPIGVFMQTPCVFHWWQATLP